MRKQYKVCEILLVSFETDAVDADKAIQNYLKEFQSKFGCHNLISVENGLEFKVLVKDNNGEYVVADDEMEEISQRGEVQIEVDNPPSPDVKGLN